MSQRQAAADLHRLLNGFQISQAIHVAAVLGVADHMATDPRPSDEIAAAVGAHPRALYRLLRALAAIGVLREHEDRRFSLAAMGECLRSDAELSVRPSATYIGQAYQWQTWGHLLHSVKTGENAFRALHGMDSWTYRARHPEQNAIFNAAMTGNSRRVDEAVVAAYDFSRCERVADIGGGQGSLLAAILAANPELRGVLFDLPHVVATAAPVLGAAGVEDRCEVVGGSMFESVPRGCAAYVMKFIIHDWDDADCTRILRACRRAMRSDAKLLVIDRFVGPPNEDPAVKLSDLNMLVGPGGQERTREEFAALFRAGGFRLANVVSTTAPVSVIVGEPDLLTEL
ncbi:MAG: methyltransferase [Candidatus Binatia bacterium]